MKIWKVFRLSRLQKNEKSCSEESTTGVFEQPFGKEVLEAEQGLSQRLQQKPGLDMG